MTFTLQALLEWIAIGEKILSAGGAGYAQIKAALEANGIEADTAQLDLIISDAERRKRIAEGESGEP